MSTIIPLLYASDKLSKQVSRRDFCVAGIITSVYGLEELRSECVSVCCLWLLHPRLQTKEYMKPIAVSAINMWKEVAHDTEMKDDKHSGFIVVAFDQRNHGTRLVDIKANHDWRSGNETHAQDLFSTYQGTAMDTSLLIDHLSSYLFPTGNHHVAKNLVMGISLGGHAAWLCLVKEPRITAAVIGIGCPDYVRLMEHRAMKSRLKAWRAAKDLGQTFVGSDRFPSSLLETITEWDPAQSLKDPAQAAKVADGPSVVDTLAEQQWRVIRGRLSDKRILNLAGAEDKLVPYHCSAPFLDFLKRARQAAISHSDDFELQDKVYDGVGHNMTTEMIQDALDFIMTQLKYIKGHGCEQAVR